MKMKSLALLAFFATSMVVNGWNSSLGDAALHDCHTEWTMLHGCRERTGFTEEPAPDSPHVLWSIDLNEAIGSAPVSSNGHLIILGSFSLFFFDLKTGESVKSFDFQGSSTPTVSGSVLLIPCVWNLVCFDLTTESVLWTSPLKGGSRSNPLVYGGKIFMGGGACPWIERADKKEEKKVVCLDQFTGDVVWEFSTGGKVCSSPSLSEGTLFIGSEDTYVYALDMSSGDVLWKTSLSAQVRDSPVVFGDTVLAAAKTLYCLDKKTGHILWEFKADSEKSPAAGYGLIFFASGSRVYALDVEGEVMWECSLDSEVTSSLVADSKVFFWTAAGTLHALDAFTGSRLWFYESGTYDENHTSFSKGTLALSDSTLVASTSNGKIFAFGIDPELYLEKAMKYEEKNQYCLAHQFYAKALSQCEDPQIKEDIEERLEKIEKEKLTEPDQNRAEFDQLLTQAYSLLYAGNDKQALQPLEEAHVLAPYVKSERAEEVECLIKSVEQKNKEKKLRVALIVGGVSALLLLLMFTKRRKKES